MTQWYEALSVLERIYFFIALPASVFLFLQTIMSIVGISGGADGDVDIDGDGEVDFDGDGNDVADGSSLRIFTLRGMVAFFSIGGWAGFLFAGTSVHIALTIIFSVIAGMLSMLIVAYSFKLALKLQADGTIDMTKAVNKTGEVYLPIGAENSKEGKIMLELGGRFVEMDAVTRGSENLGVGRAIRVTEMLTDSIAVVEAIMQDM